MPRRNLLDDLRRLSRAATANLVTLKRAAAALELPRREATLRLSALARRKVIRRVRRGIFLVPPLNTADRGAARVWHADVLAHALFEPCYVGGWSAALHWGLPTVLRRESLIVTSARIRATSVRVEDAFLHLVRLPAPLIAGPGIERLFGDVKVSSRVRTLVDALRAPAWIGGSLFLMDALQEYRLSSHWNPDLMRDVLKEAGNAPALRRLGAIADAAGLDYGEVWVRVSDWRRKGVIDLEPGAGKVGRIARPWNVRMNFDLEQSHLDDDDPGDDGIRYDEEYEEWLEENESEAIGERGPSG